jgi:hypothetical protein
MIVYKILNWIDGKNINQISEPTPSNMSTGKFNSKLKQVKNFIE